MIRIILFVAFVLTHLSGMAQEKNVDTTKYLEDMLIDPIEYPPAMLNCENLELGKLKSCNYEEMVKTIRNNLLLPKELDTIDTKVRVYVSFIVDTNAQVSEIEIVRGAEYYFAANQSDLVQKLNSEAIRVVSLFTFTKPAQMHGKAIRQLMTVPISFSNPEKTDTPDAE